jgi:predicted SAM-dependent methyltransferase
MENEFPLVQYGCGWSAPSSWMNFDASPTLRFERLPLVGKLYTRNAERFPQNVRFGDIVKGLPLEDNSCRAAYCSHVLEHLSLEDTRLALFNTKRILRKSAVFRLVLPDLKKLIDTYLQSEGPDSALNFMRETGMASERRPKNIAGALIDLLGNSRHQWLWDYPSLERELANTGFTSIRRAYFNDSEEIDFKSVEVQARWDGCLGIQCRA